MTKRIVQQLVQVSYHNDKIDTAVVEKISKRLTRRDLKAYIRALKLMEQKSKLYIAMPTASVYNTAKKDLQGIFPKKELVFEEDPSLLLGIRIRDNDTVYEMSLKDRLENILEEVEQMSY